MRKKRVIAGIILSAIVFFFVFPALFIFIAWVLGRLVGLAVSPLATPAAWLLAGLSWTLGLFWIFWSYSYLVFVGSGSPVEAFGAALEPTKYLVTTGPYAYVRNPMVFGLLFILLGFSFLANLLIAIILVPVAGLIAAAYLRYIEEPHLIRRFGAAYKHYREHVPMLIPRFTAYIAQA